MIRSPFRYPGGKQRLVRPILDVVGTLGMTDCFVDAFVGGGSVALAVAGEYRQARITMNDLDPAIAAFWRVVVTDPAELRDRVTACAPTVQQFEDLRAAGLVGTDTDRAFFALFFNRTTFSGVLRSGPIGGYTQASRWTIGCRWNASLLADTIGDIHTLLRGRTVVTEHDACAVTDDCVAYFDPPYFEKGDSLYGVKMDAADHDRLAEHLQQRSAPWLLSYDDHPEIERRYAWAVVTRIPARYSVSGATRASWVPKNELLIASKEVSWAQQMNLLAI